MRQDIIEYCTNDVVCLPVLWNLYSRKLSPIWAAKVKEETRKRLLMSQAVSYDPHGENKTLSPWAKPEQYRKPNHSRYENNVGTGITTQKHESAAVITAMNAAQRKAGTQPEAKLALQSSSGNTYPQPTKITDPNVTKEIPNIYKRFEDLPPLPQLPVRSKPASDRQAMAAPESILHPTAPPSKWTCLTCSREMQALSKQAHLAGKPHIARLEQANIVTTEAKSPSTAVIAKSSRKARNKPKPKPKPKPKSKSKSSPQPPNPSQAKGISASGHSGDPSQQLGLPYPPDYGFSGFAESSTSRRRNTSTKNNNYDGFGDYGPNGYGCLDYGICDKDCGWCGHCMDGVGF